MLGISLAKSVICHMTTRVLNVLTDGTGIPCHTTPLALTPSLVPSPIAMERYSQEGKAGNNGGVARTGNRIRIKVVSSGCGHKVDSVGNELVPALGRIPAIGPGTRLYVTNVQPHPIATLSTLWPQPLETTLTRILFPVRATPRLLPGPSFLR